MEIKSRQVVIKPVNKPRFSGIAAHTRAIEVLGCELGKDGYKTGLTKKEEAEFEKELGLKEGTLAKNSDWWGDLEIRLRRDKANYFAINGPMDELKYRCILQSTKIANSEIDLFKNPEYDFVIEDAQVKAEAEEKVLDKEIYAFEIFNNLGIEEKRGLLKAYGKRGVDDLNETQVKSALGKEMKLNVEEFIKRAEDKTLEIKIFVEELLEHNILSRHKNFYKNGDDIIANSTEEIVEFFMDKKNQTVKLALQSKLTSIKKGKA